MTHTPKKRVKDRIKKGMYESATIFIFEHPSDIDNGRPPLFKYKVKITDIDLERIEEIERLEVEFKLKTP